MPSLTLRTVAIPSLAVPPGVARKPIGLIVGGLVAVLIAATPVSVGAAATTSSATMVAAGDFLGFDATGLPVHRLPSIGVSVDRKMALARIAQEDKLARTSKLRVRTTERDTSGNPRHTAVAECFDCGRSSLH